MGERGLDKTPGAGGGLEAGQSQGDTRGKMRGMKAAMPREMMGIPGPR